MSRDWEFTAKGLTTLLSIGGMIFVGIIALFMWGCPTYNVWKKEMDGKAKLAEAEHSRQIRVAEATAEEEALMLEANGKKQREILLAEGAAEAIRIVKEQEMDDAYLRWLWINEVAGSNGERIYIPTENGLPAWMLEAGSFNHSPE